MIDPRDLANHPLLHISDEERAQMADPSLRKDFDPLTTRSPNRPGIQARDMVLLIDQLLAKHSPAAEPFDPTTPRAIACQLQLADGTELAGVLSETYFGGIYRMACKAQKQDKTLTVVEYFFTAEAITSIAIERPDLTELAKQAQRNGDNKIWTPR